MRSPEELQKIALAVLDLAFTTPALTHHKGSRKKSARTFKHYAEVMAPLLSGGHDSICACHVASRHPRFGKSREVFHIDTGIGAKATRAHVEAVCREFNWKLTVLKSPDTYEMFVRDRGFPGPGRHHWVYARLKERCIRTLVKRRRVVLVTGCRSQESARRMGHVEPLKIGELRTPKVGKLYVRDKNRFWSAPCHDWSAEEQQAYMEHFDLPKNPLKLALGMSGECACGSFAAPGEIERRRQHAPDVVAEIDRLTVIARECGKHAVWGTRPDKKKGVQAVQSGPLCSSCDYRAAAAGVVFEPVTEEPPCPASTDSNSPRGKTKKSKT